MDAKIPKRFEKALEKLGIIVLEAGEIPPKKLIPYGHYTLSENPKLIIELCNRVAEKTKAFWDYQEFIGLQNRTITAPEKPDQEDPKFDPPDIQYDFPLDRQVAKIYRYNLALETHEKETQDYQRLRTQIRRYRAANQFNERGYMVYLSDTLSPHFPDFVQSFFFTPKTLFINEKARQKHTFITGGTGSGKSETIKTIIRHYLTKNTEPALVVLDPHGDLAEDVARFEENAQNDRLVYVRPNYFKGRDIAFNPFDTDNIDEIALNRAQIQFLGALEQIIGETLTKPQRALLTPCIGVLLHKENASFRDLVKFMDDERNNELVKYGREHLPNEQDRDFFKHQFHSRNFESTKDALRYRFNEVIRDPSVRSFLCNKSTVHLPELLQAGKVIVFHFDPDKQTKEAIRTIGQLITAYITSFAMSRPKGERRSIHLFADECQYFVSPTISEIMGETRKFGLYATLATQRTEQVGRDLLDAIFGNVGCYLIGRNKNQTAEKMAKEHPITADQIRELKPLQFYQIELDREPVMTKIDIIGSKFGLKGEHWRDLLLKQGELYYRPDFETPHEYASKGNYSAVTDQNQNRQHSPTKPEPKRKPMFPIPNVAEKK